jgi:hypothetical protein
MSMQYRSPSTGKTGQRCGAAGATYGFLKDWSEGMKSRFISVLSQAAQLGVFFAAAAALGAGLLAMR